MAEIGIVRQGGASERALFAEIAGVADTVRRAATRGDYWNGMARFVNYWNGDGAWAELSHEARIKLSQRLGKVVLDFQALFEEPAILADYAVLTPPTLIVCGERSPGPSRRIVEMLAGAMPHARVAPIAGAGHMSPLTHRDAVNAAIRDHLHHTTAAHRRRAA